MIYYKIIITLVTVQLSIESHLGVMFRWFGPCALARALLNYTMCARLEMSASTIMFCCIMLRAMLVVTSDAGGHINVGPNTMARLATCIRFTSLEKLESWR